jgi:hypothetical protein
MLWEKEMKIFYKIQILVIIGVLFASLSGCILPGQPPEQKPEGQKLEPTILSAIPIEIPGDPTKEPPAKIYLIALEDNGKSGPVVGCGDSLVEVMTQAAEAKSALQLLLQNHNQWYGESGLYNPLYQSKLILTRFETANGGIEVNLTGNLLLGGVCDNPRVNDQLKATIRQSTSETPPVTIRINGTLLEDLLSQK